MGDEGVSLVSEQRLGLRAMLVEGTVKNGHDVVIPEQRKLKTGIPCVDLKRGEQVVIGAVQ
ncbi:MAG: hypothetical protein OEW13_11300 [Nitrospira sp.]|nr:hypothetical protein [Nitrospira sp.]